MKQLKSDERIKGTFEIAFLARFAHCVSFTILKLSYQFVQSYWDNQLEYLQKPFGFSNKQTAQKHLQTIFQQQFNSSFIQLYSQGRQFITLKLKEQIVEENENFAYLFDSILNTTSKHFKIQKEFLGKENGCNDIGYFTWPSLIRCDTNDLLDVPITACYAHLNLNVLNQKIELLNVRSVYFLFLKKKVDEKTGEETKIEQTDKSSLLKDWIEQYDKMEQANILVLNILRIRCNEWSVERIRQWTLLVVFYIADCAYQVAYDEIIDKKNIENVKKDIEICYFKKQNLLCEYYIKT
ncbi:hypothetical protein RFI_34768 [Reticulomyxa filosa]|uniref:Uncharacterized protein n=1 Tax=Reticulomyxa filosa TaxID=46433 RepID=X6LMN4_RETFI|nr:hypothetical protein RFI_34768 [Reticulomyxa filosa]|eukprot:ETO02651.1 hypothetical protein RFI_34768 [Reticulomyxa filosa]